MCCIPYSCSTTVPYSESSHATRRLLLQRLRNRRKLPILDEGHRCDRMLSLQRRKDTHRTGPRVRFDRGVDDRVERLLGLGHGGTLGFGGGEILAARNRLYFGNLPGRVVDNDLRERLPLHGVHGELQLALLQLKLAGDRDSFPFTRREPLC